MKTYTLLAHPFDAVPSRHDASTQLLARAVRADCDRLRTTRFACEDELGFRQLGNVRRLEMCLWRLAWRQPPGADDETTTALQAHEGLAAAADVLMAWLESGATQAGLAQEVVGDDGEVLLSGDAVAHCARALYWFGRGIVDARNWHELDQAVADFAAAGAAVGPGVLARLLLRRAQVKLPGATGWEAGGK